MPGQKVVIVSSYRKFYDAVLQKISDFEALGDVVLSPPKSKVVDASADFVRLEVDNDTPNRVIEEAFLSAIKVCDFVYVFNPEGYVGLSGALEIGFAYALGKTIICKEIPKDSTIAMFCKLESA